MKTYRFKHKDFLNSEDGIKVCTRMGWEVETDSEGFTVYVPDEDCRLIELIFDYFM